MFFSLFFIGKTSMFEHRNPSQNLFCHLLLDFDKKLKIDQFEHCISEHFPIAYGGIHMKLLNLELFISKAFTLLFHAFSFNFYVFMVVQDSGPGPPPSKLGFDSTPT